MAYSRTYLDYINKSIDIAPTNSQEEVDAAQTLAQIMNDHKLDVSQQDVFSHGWGLVAHDALYVLVFVGMLMSGFAGTVVGYIGFVICALAFALLVLDRFNIFKVSELGPLAQSQNVIGVHRACGPLVMKGNRPIVIVAHYDTPNEDLLSHQQLAPYQARIKKIMYSALVFTAFCALVQVALFLPFITDTPRRIFWLLGVLSSLSPLAYGANTLYKKFSPCTEGANDNKAALAALLGVLDKVRPMDDAAKHASAFTKKPVLSEYTGKDAGGEQKPAAAGADAAEGAEEAASADGAQSDAEGQHPREKKTEAEILAMTTILPVEPDQPADAADADEKAVAEVAKASDEAADQALEQAKTNADDNANADAMAPVEAPTEDAASSVVSAASEDEFVGEDTLAEAEYDLPEGYVRHGVDTLRSLEILPASCEISYDVAYKEPVQALNSDEGTVADAAPAQAFDVLSPEHGDDGFVSETASSARRVRTSAASFALDGRENDEAVSPEVADEVISYRTHAYNVRQFEAAYPIASWEAAPAPSAADKKNQSISSNVSDTSDTHDASGKEVAAHDANASQDTVISASKDKNEAANENSNESGSSVDARSVTADSVSSPEAAPASDASREQAADAQLSGKTQAMDPLSESAQEDQVQKNPEDQIISEIHRSLSRAQHESAQSEEERAHAAQVLQQQQEALGGGSNKNMALRAALFDLPDPLQETNDPFATGVSAPLDEHKFEEAPANAKSAASVAAPTQPTSASAASVPAPNQSPATQAALRSHRLFGKKKSNTDDAESMSQWLGVEEGYDAKKDGREIGSWDNFVHEDEGASKDADSHGHSASHGEAHAGKKSSSHWKGGAATRKGLRPYPLGDDEPESSAVKDGELELPTLNDIEREDVADAADAFDAQAPSEFDENLPQESLSLDDNPFVQEGVVQLFQNDAPAVVRKDAADSADAASDAAADLEALESGDGVGYEAAGASTSDQEHKPSLQDLQDEILSMGEDELLCHDIWFVALGASEHDHAGMKQFLSEHKRDIRGAFLINLDCIGAGSLSVLTHEDNYQTRHADKRLERLIQSVAKDLHIGVNKVKYDFGTTDATPAMHASVRAATLMGCDANDLPALSHTAEDSADKVDAKQVVNVVQLLCELIRRS